MNTKTIPEQIREAKTEMETSILNALTAFTEKTGLMVSDVGWHCEDLLYSDGSRQSSVYYDFRSTVGL